MNRLMLTVGAILTAQCLLFSAPKPFERVETFPAGKQEGAAGTILGFKDTNNVTVTLSAPYPAVWAAVKAVARKFDKVGGRPVTGIDEQSGRVQNGRITSDGLIGSQGGIAGSWADEFVSEATRDTPTTTRLSVTRKLVQKGGFGNTSSKWETRGSNGKIERWLITEVMKELETPASQNVTETTTDVNTVRYALKTDEKNYLELNGDGSFRLIQLGKQYRGQYTVAGEELTLNVGTQAIKGRLSGNSMFDEQGSEWVKKTTAANAPEPIPAPKKSAADTNFSNTDVIKLVEAKLPDSVIVSKIKSSSCNFDVTTDGLIKLKQANASDSVVQAVIDCKQ